MVCVDRDGSTLAAHPGSGRSNDRSGHCRWRVDRAGEDVTRLVEAGFLKRYHPLLSARLATLAHPIGAAIVLVAAVPSQA